MRQKRIRTKLFKVWLHEKELEFRNKYAEDAILTVSEVIRALIHQLMKREGHEIKDPSLSTQKIKSRNG
jgi:hypothetical protein